MNTGRTWMEDGQRRQAGPLVGLHWLYACCIGYVEHLFQKELQRELPSFLIFAIHSSDR